MLVAKPFNHFLRIIFTAFAILLIGFSCNTPDSEGALKMGLDQSAIDQTVNAMIEKFGEQHRALIETGVKQAAQNWTSSDGSKKDFENFCLEKFTIDPDRKRIFFERYQKNLESYYGNLHQIRRQFRWALDVNRGQVQPIDYLFVNIDPFAHLSEDFFNSKIAFAAVLNYPNETLEAKNQAGMDWSREKWAEVRLVEEFTTRIPADVSRKRSNTYTLADDYIANYNIYMHHLVDSTGQRLFPEGLKLISHWGLRDELKAQYANPDGYSRQKMIHQVMKRIIRQQIPEGVINSYQYDWNPVQNEIYEKGTTNVLDMDREPDTRYQHIWNIYQAEKSIDPYYPHAPSLIDRRFKLNREMTEEDVENLLTSITSAPVLKAIAQVIRKRLGRDLEPFDIWYNGFKGKSDFSEELLDKKVGKMYPTVEAFQKDIPYILRQLGFSPEKSEFLARHIAVDPSRGAGHAMGAMMKDDKAHLRTRIPEGGMKYKGFNIAIHELGHNVEQVFSLNGVDYYSLNGVPNTAFTEAFAFVFQSRDMQVLGIEQTSSDAEALLALNDMWATFEISGVALTDMYIWRWMYENPNANAEQLKQAMLDISKKVWNTYFAPVLGIEDQSLLCIYSHIVDGGMYTPDYPLGHIISFQVEEYLKSHGLAVEMERMCKLGRLSPQIWMQQAVGEKISVEPLITAAEEAVKKMDS